MNQCRVLAFNSTLLNNIQKLTFDTRRMSENQRDTRNVDDYPVRPNAVTQDDRTQSYRVKNQTRAIVISSLIFFLYGAGLSVSTLLYQNLARKNGFASWIYGSVLALSHLTCVLFYPVSCQIVSKVSIRNSFSVSVFVMGSCRILFGTLYLIPDQKLFITLSYAIQLVDGIGISIFIASTVITTGGMAKRQLWKFSELGFYMVFCIIGGITVLSVILTATILKEPEQRINYMDIPVVYWMSDKRMLGYFLIMLETFIYVGFLSVSLGSTLKKFSLNNLYFSMTFSFIPFVYGSTIAGWKWLIKKGFNNVMMVFIGCVMVIASLILLGPSPFTSLQSSLTFVYLALTLEGLGLALKCTCVLDAAEMDLRYQKKHTEIQQKLIVPTIVLTGASFGYFCGLLTAGIMEKKATLLHFILEILTGIAVVIFAMNRNYVSKRLRESTAESQPILRS